jgi:hypothetical protein
MVSANATISSWRIFKTLNDDDALEMFKKTLPGSSASFVQMSLALKTERDRALAEVRKAQHTAIAARPGLDFIALALQGKAPGFGKVIKMIDEMVATLKQEQIDDDNKKEYCRTELDLSDDKKKSLEHSLSDLETSIADTEEAIAQLKDEIDALEKSLCYSLIKGSDALFQCIDFVLQLCDSFFSVSDARL